MSNKNMRTHVDMISISSAKSIVFITIFLSFFSIIYPNLMLTATLFKKTSFSSALTGFIGAAGIIISYILTVKNKTYFDLNPFYSRVLLIFVPFLTLMVFIFILRGHNGIYDLFNPTNLLGMTERARQGQIPLSFSSLPDFPANYHQAFIILAGGFSQLTGWTALKSLTLLFPILSALILVHLFIASSRSEGTPTTLFLLIILFLFISSFPHLQKNLIIDNNYLIFPDIYYSNSWVLGSLTVLMVSHFFLNMNIRYSIPWEVIILIFCLISINATLFMALWTVVLFIALTHLIKNIKVKQEWKKPLFLTIALLAVYLLARHIPSAFLKGIHYSNVGMRFKYFVAEKRQRDWNESLETLRLTGPWILLLFYGLRPLWLNEETLLHKKTLNISFQQFLFLFSIIFPLIITADNISRWDAVHKFSVMGMISGFIFIIYLLRNKQIKLSHFYIFSFFSLILTIPNAFDFIHHRIKLSPDNSWKFLPTEKNIDFYNYLLTQKNRIMIYPVFQYSADCEISKIASFSGDFVGNTYYPGFLVNIDMNDYPMPEDHWSSAQKFSGYLKKTHLHSLIAIERKKQSDFMNMLSEFKKDRNFNVVVDTEHPLMLKNYILYSYTKTV